MRAALLTGYAVLALLGMAALVAPRISLPQDTGTWAPLALDATSVTALVAVDDGVLAAHGARLSLLRPDGVTSELDVPAPVRALAVSDDDVYAATTAGVVAVPLSGDAARPAGLQGTPVHAIDTHDGVMYAGSDHGLHRRDEGGEWARVWPARGQRHSAISAVSAVSGDAVLFIADAVIVRWSVGRPGEVVLRLPDAPAVSLSRGTRRGQVWAGLRGGPLLMESRDAGLTWTQRGNGLGFTAVNDIAPDPTRPERLLAAGSGLADGTGNAGTEQSSDAGASWRTQQGLLSNTHVFAVESRQEPRTLEIFLPLVDRPWRVGLPVDHVRSYAATNGSGVQTITPSSTLDQALGRLHGPSRTAEPLLLGLLPVLVLVPAYVRLSRSGTAPGPVPATTNPSTAPTRSDT